MSNKYLFLIAICFFALGLSIHASPKNSAGTGPVRAGIVLGNYPAGPDTPAALQTARCLKAFELYREGTVNRLLVTGGFTRAHISEARMMKIALVTYGIPPEDIVEEELSATTVENAVFSSLMFEKLGWEKKALLISQKMHLLRAEPIFRDHGFRVKSVNSDDPAERAEDFAAVTGTTADAVEDTGPVEMIIVYEPFDSRAPLDWPTPALARRLRAAAALYHRKAAPRVLLYADWYTRGPMDPAQMMRVAALSLGVKPEHAAAVEKIHYGKSAELIKLYGDRTAIVLTERAAAEKIDPDSAPLWKFVFP